jgi:hypothetical protein
MSFVIRRTSMQPSLPHIPLEVSMPNRAKSLLNEIDDRPRLSVKTSNALAFTLLFGLLTPVMWIFVHYGYGVLFLALTVASICAAED